jgi:hypothetical protein
MSNRLGRLAARRPWLIVGLWVLATIALLPLSGSLTDHIKTDQSSPSRWPRSPTPTTRSPASNPHRKLVAQLHETPGSVERSRGACRP